jgi:hypothetical protein
MKPFSKRRIIVLLVGFTCIAGGLWLFCDSHRFSAEAEWLSSRPTPRRSRLEFLGRWTRPVKQQIARIREKTIGAPPLIDARGLVVEFDPAVPPHVPAANASLTNQMGDVMFVFSNSDFEQTLRTTPGIHVLTAPRMTVGSGMQSQMSMTTSTPIGVSTNLTFQPLGWWVDFWPHVRRSGIDITCFFTSTEGAVRRTVGGALWQREAFIRTNVAFGARATIPANGSLFLLSHNTNSNGKVIGAFLSPRMQKQ